ncbi:MAG TPA: hypothetical protein VI588_00855 [Candidatus Gracilibacteria bacterium]|nr:hypothetical protein [Candidatus Gracilibacteria bacterium]
MADGDKGNSGNGNKEAEPKESVSDRIRRLKGEQPQGLPTQLAEIKSKEQEAKKETPRETADIKRDVLETQVMGPDRQTAEGIMGIDKLTDDVEIDRELENLWTVSTILFAKLYDAGIQKGDVETIEKFRGILDDPAKAEKARAAFEKMGNTEKIAFQKLREIASHPESKICGKLRDSWTIFINKSSNLYRKAADAKAQLLGEKEPGKKENGILASIKKHPLAAAALVAGAIGLYYLLKPKKGEGIINKKTGVLMGILAVGALIGPEKIIDTIGKVLHISKEKAAIFFKHLFNGDIKEAFSSLWEGSDENMDNYVDIAQKISDEMGKKVEAKVIKKVANVSYKDFISVKGKTKTMLMDKAKNLSGPLGFAADLLTDNEQMEQEPVIRDYLKKHADKIKSFNLPETATLAEVLAKLTGAKLDVAPAPAAAPGEGEERKKTELEKDMSDLFRMPAGMESFGLSRDALKELDRDILQHAPHLKELFNKYEGNWTKVPTFEFTAELYSALKRDAIPTIVHTGGLILFTGAKWVTLLSAKSIVNLFTDLAEAPFDDDKGVGDAMKNYAAGIAPFALLFAGANVLKQGVFTVVGGQKFHISEVIKSAGKGFIFPAEVVNMYYKGGDMFYRNAKGLELQIKQWNTTGPERIAILEERAKFYAEQVNRFQSMYEASQKPVDGIKSGFKKVYTNIELERIERLRAKYLQQFKGVFEQLPQGEQITVDIKDKPSLNEAAKKAQEYLKKAKERGVGGVTGPEKFYEMEAKRVGDAEGFGDKRKHRFRFGTEEYTFTETELMQEVGEVEKRRIDRGDKKPTDPEKVKLWDQQNEKLAANSLGEKRFLAVEEIPGKTNTFKFAGQEMVLDPAKIQLKVDKGMKPLDAAREVAVEETVKGATIEEVRVTNGVQKYKIGGKWITAENPKTPAEFAEIKQKFADVLGKEGKAAEFQKFNFENSKALRFFGALEKTLGTAAAVMIIIHLETAQDKTKAVAETAAGFGAFVAGQKLTHAALRAFMKPPYTGGKVALVGLLSLAGGLAAAFGVTKPMGEVVDQFLSNLVPGAEFAAPEMIGIIEAASIKPVARMVFKSMGSGVLRKGMLKVGLTGLEKFLTRKLESTLFTRIGRLATKQGFKQIVKCLGWRGALVAGTLANDVTVIGVVDNIVGLGLTAWMAKDIYDLVRIVLHAQTVEREMAVRGSKEVSKMELADGKSREEAGKILKARGTTVDQLMLLSDNDLDKLLSELSQPNLRIWREGVPGYETYSFRNGQPIGIRINNAQGEIIAEVSNEDLEKADEPLDNVDIKDPPSETAGEPSPATGT